MMSKLSNYLDTDPETMNRRVAVVMEMCEYMYDKKRKYMKAIFTDTCAMKSLLMAVAKKIVSTRESDCSKDIFIFPFFFHTYTKKKSDQYNIENSQ